MVKMCVVYGCNNSYKTGHSCHKFPPDPSKRQEWTRFVKVRRKNFLNPRPNSDAVICEVHFKPECYNIVENDILQSMGERKKKVLLPGSVPTIQYSGYLAVTRRKLLVNTPSTVTVKKPDTVKMENPSQSSPPTTKTETGENLPAVNKSVMSMVYSTFCSEPASVAPYLDNPTQEDRSVCIVSSGMQPSWGRGGKVRPLGPPPESLPGLIKCPSYCRSNCTIQHHPLLVAILNCVDTEEMELMELKLGILHNVINKYRGMKWNPDDDIPDAVEEYRYPLIHWACTLGRVGAAVWLIGQKVSHPRARAMTCNMETGLHRALICLQETCPREANRKFIQLLSVMEPGLAVKDRDGNTPIHICCEMLRIEVPRRGFYRDALHYMLFELNNNRTKEEVTAVLNIQNNDGDTALHLLSETDRCYVQAKLVVHMGAEILIENKKGMTPLQLACNPVFNLFVHRIATEHKGLKFIVEAHGPGSGSKKTEDKKLLMISTGALLGMHDQYQQKTLRVVRSPLKTIKAQEESYLLKPLDTKTIREFPMGETKSDTDGDSQDRIFVDDVRTFVQSAANQSETLKRKLSCEDETSDPEGERSKAKRELTFDTDNQKQTEAKKQKPESSGSGAGSGEKSRNSATMKTGPAEPPCLILFPGSDPEEIAAQAFFEKTLKDLSSKSQTKQKVSANETKTQETNNSNQSKGPIVGSPSEELTVGNESEVPTVGSQSKDPFVGSRIIGSQSEEPTLHHFILTEYEAFRADAEILVENPDPQKLNAFKALDRKVLMSHLKLLQKDNLPAYHRLIEFLVNTRNETVQNLKYAEKSISCLKEKFRETQKRQDSLVGEIMVIVDNLSDLQREEQALNTDIQKLSQQTNSMDIANQVMAERLQSCDDTLRVLQNLYKWKESRWKP